MKASVSYQILVRPMAAVQVVVANGQLAHDWDTVWVTMGHRQSDPVATRHPARLAAGLDLLAAPGDLVVLAHLPLRCTVRSHLGTRHATRQREAINRRLEDTFTRRLKVTPERPSLTSASVNGQVEVPTGGHEKSPPRRGGLRSSSVAHLLAVWLPSSGRSHHDGDDGGGVVQEAVEHGHRGRVLGQEATPGLEGPVGGHAQAAVLVGGGHEAEEQVAAGVVQGREAEVVDDDEVVAQEALDDPADRVVGEAAVERLDERGGRQIAHLPARTTAASPRPSRMCDLPVPAGPTSTTFSAPSIQSSEARCSKVVRGIDDSARSKPSSRLVTGKPAALRLAASLEASRAAISASTNVRSRSSGAQRWTLAVLSTSGAIRRTAASFRRRKPASRSGSRVATWRGLTRVP